MALVPPVVAAAILASLGGSSILGISAAQLASAVAGGLCSYLLSAPVVTTADVGSLGAGTGTGLGLIVSPPSLFAAMRSTFSGFGINGTHSEPLIQGLSNGICQALLAAQVETVDAGTGVGVGTITAVAPVPAVSVPTMLASFAGAGLAGVSAAGLATAIAQAFDEVLPTARGQTVIVGAGSPYPGGGVGVGRIS